MTLFVRPATARPAYNITGPPTTTIYLGDTNGTNPCYGVPRFNNGAVQNGTHDGDCGRATTGTGNTLGQRSLGFSSTHLAVGWVSTSAAQYYLPGLFVWKINCAGTFNYKASYLLRQPGVGDYDGFGRRVSMSATHLAVATGNKKKVVWVYKLDSNGDFPKTASTVIDEPSPTSSACR